MSSTAPLDAPVSVPDQCLGVLFDELAQLQGQRNAIDSRIVEIVAEIDRDGLWGATGARSVESLVAWKTGCSPGNAKTITTVARRLDAFPRCAQGLRDGVLSLDQVGVVAQRASEGSDEHYAALAGCATVNQLRTALRLEPRPQPDRRPEPERSITEITDEQSTCWKITLPHIDAAKVDTALQSHLDALVAEWKHDHHDPDAETDQAPPFPTLAEAFLRLVDTSWDTEVARRPHGQHTTVVMHLDVQDRAACLHLGPMLTDAERQYLACDATYETWFTRDGQPFGTGRTTRQISRQLRRALEHRHPTCAVPGCGATRGLHAHHIAHWEDGGPTELSNLVMVCPYHHRLHHQGTITITGPGDAITVTDTTAQELNPGSLARPPNRPPPDAPPYPGPTGEKADWKRYHPFQPYQPPAHN